MADDIGGVWRTVGGRRIFIKDGQDLASAMKESGKFDKKDTKIKKETDLNKAIEKIRNAKKENLIIANKNGNIEYQEKGNSYHTGTGNYEMKDKIVIHNHPDKVMPYPSKKDFETFEEKGLNKMIVVSKDYTYTYENNPDYQLKGKSGIGYYIEQNSYNDSIARAEINDTTVKMYKEGKYSTIDEYKNDTIKRQTEYMNKKYKEYAEKGGYKLTITKIN